MTSTTQHNTDSFMRKLGWGLLGAAYLWLACLVVGSLSEGDNYYLNQTPLLTLLGGLPVFLALAIFGAWVLGSPKSFWISLSLSVVAIVTMSMAKIALLAQEPYVIYPLSLTREALFIAALFTVSESWTV